MRRIRSHLTYANVMVTILAFIVLSGGSAVALSGSNTVFTDDIANDTQAASGGNPAGGLAAVDLRPGSVGSSEAANNSLTGTDIDEATLGEVPSATLGGLGNQSGSNNCFPESTSFATCAVGFIDLPAPARLLIIGQIRAEPDTGNGNGGGSCRVYSGPGPDALTPEPVFVNGGQTDVIAISGITSVVGPGSLPFGLLCNETADGIRYFDGHVSVVAISPD